jgi:hypothetical protein
MATPTSICPGCKLELPATGGPAVAGRGSSSAECWLLYGEVLGREMRDLTLVRELHQLTVDTYGAQHPPADGTGIGLAFSLIGLHLALDLGVSGPGVRDAHQRLAATGATWPAWTVPADLGPVTCFDVALTGTSDEHAAATRAWAASVWAAWSPVHDAVAELSARLDPESQPARG